MKEYSMMESILMWKTFFDVVFKQYQIQIMILMPHHNQKIGGYRYRFRFYDGVLHSLILIPE